VRQHIIPNFHAILSVYHNEASFNEYLTHHDIDATVDTWLTDTTTTLSEGNSSDLTSAMLEELDTILQSFPQLQPDDIMQHLPALNPILFLALDNANDTLTRSQML